MTRDIEARLREAYQAKAAQVPESEPGRRVEADLELPVIAASSSSAITDRSVPPGILNHRRVRRWAPLLAAAAVVALVAGAALTRLDRSGHRPAGQPPLAQQLLLPTSSISRGGISNGRSSEPTANRGPAPSPAVTRKSELPPPMLPAGAQGSRSQVPWADIGPGWTLAQWSRSDRYSDSGMANPVRDQPESLFLVDPAGGRYLISTFPVGGQWTMLDWSDNGRSALLRGGSGEVWSQLAVLDLPSGNLRTLKVPGGHTAESLLGGRDGRSALVSTSSGFQQLSPTGQVQLTFPIAIDGLTGLLDAAYSPDRTLVAFGADNGMALFTADAKFVGKLAPAGSASPCYPIRWSSDEQVIARCDTGVWLFPTAGGKPVRLTPDPSGPAGAIYDAMPVGSVVLYPVGTSCATYDLAYSDGSRPGGRPADLQLDAAVLGGGIRFVEAQSSTVQLLSVGGCGHAGTLTSRNIDTHTNTTLLGGQLNGGGVIAAVGNHNPAS